MNIVKKITHGFVVQSYDLDTKKFIAQEFVAGDQIDWEDENGEPIPPLEEPYLPFDMRSPIDDYEVLVVKEPDGSVVRCFVVPAKNINSTFMMEVADLAEYGNQDVQWVGADSCDTLEQVKEIFDEMNPPDEDGDKNE